MDEEKYFCNNCKRNICASNFATHSAYCERNIKVCKLCNEPVSISEEKKHIKQFHIVVTCKQCHIQVEQWVMPKHQASCTMRLVTCEFCDGEYPFPQFSEHYDFCSSRTEKCLLCQKYVMLKDKPKHSEMHSYSRKIQQENIEKEVKQNIVNEKLSSSNAFEPNIPDKVAEAKKFSASSEKDMFEEKDFRNLKSGISIGASADIPQNINQISKHYGTCHICRQSIPWIDMNTHIPNCATDLGKCSRCGEDVPDYAVKDHFMKNCKMVSAKGPFVDETVSRKPTNSRGTGYLAQKDLEEHSIECQYCKQRCSEDRIEEHTRNCLEKCTYECPLGTETLVEKDKVYHDSFECKVQLGRNPDSSNTPSLKNLRIEPDETCEMSSKYEICGLCNNIISEQNHLEHLHNCPELQKRNCLYCYEEIYVSREDAHLVTCKGFVSQASISVNQNNKSGAVPKNSNFAYMGKPQTPKCKFCKTELNIDLIYNHEQQCRHQPLKCERCDSSIPLKDFEKHNCKSKKKEKIEQKSKSEKTAVSSVGFGNKLRNALGLKSEANDGCKDTKSLYSSDTFSPYDYYNQWQFLDTEEIKIPCEFCEKLFPVSDIVLHQTGCQPGLVSYAKKDSQEEEKESKPSFAPDQSNLCSKETLPAKNFFFVERKRDFVSTRSAKKNSDSNVKPGEFLEDMYDTKTSLSFESKTAKDPNKFEDNYSTKSPAIQSVWNKLADDESDDEGEISDEHKPVANECIINSDKEMTEMLEFINEGDITVTSDAKIHNAKEMIQNMTENKMIFEDSKSTSNLYKEALKALNEVNVNFDETNLIEPLISFASETNVQSEKFTMNPDKSIFDNSFIETNGLEQGVEKKAEDLLMQYNSQEGDCENTEDLKKWAKWQCRNSSDS